MKDKTCFIVCGATAVGKTSYAIDLAKKYNTQIISADSRQCYKELDIGVARPSEEQLTAVHHYFINSHSIHDEVNVKVFEQYALTGIKKIFQANDHAVMAGGTGLYIKAFCEGLDDVPELNTDLRNEINEAYKTGGLQWLQEEIREKDPEYFASGETANPQRLMRALEVKLSTGNSILYFQSGKKAIREFDIKVINLEIPRGDLYNRINSRVDEMMKQGLLKEVEALYSFKQLNALQTVGYKELFEYMDGQISLGEAIERIKKNTRQFAKRQITWFKKRV